MFDEFRKRRSRGDILDVPDWAYLAYLVAAMCISIGVIYLLADHLPARISVLNVLLSLITIFIGIGIFLIEWITRSPLRRVLPIISGLFVIALVVLGLPVIWVGPLALIVLGYQRYRLWRGSRKADLSHAP